MLDSFKSFFERNAEQVRILQNVVVEFGWKPLKELLQHVYGLKSRLRGQNVTIAELPMRHPILIPYRFENRIEVTVEELTKLRVLMDPETEHYEVREVKGREVVLFKVRGDRWISAVVPSLPGCFTQGLTAEEAMRNAEEAIELHLETEN